MPTVEFLPLEPRAINVRTFDCGKKAISVYLRHYAVKNMALNLSDPKSQILLKILAVMVTEKAADPFNQNGKYQ